MEREGEGEKDQSLFRQTLRQAQGEQWHAIRLIPRASNPLTLTLALTLTLNLSRDGRGDRTVPPRAHYALDSRFARMTAGGVLETTQLHRFSDASPLSIFTYRFAPDGE